MLNSIRTDTAQHESTTFGLNQISVGRLGNLACVGFFELRTSVQGVWCPTQPTVYYSSGGESGVAALGCRPSPTTPLFGLGNPLSYCRGNFMLMGK